MGSRDSLMHYGLPPIGTHLKPNYFIGYLGKKITSFMSPYDVCMFSGKIICYLIISQILAFNLKIIINIRYVPY